MMTTVSRCFVALSIILLAAAGLSAARLSAAEWQPAHGPLATRWAKDVSPTNALPEYPRPQMVRKEWQNLNGLWDYAIRPQGRRSAGRNSKGRFSCRIRSSRRCRA